MAISDRNKAGRPTDLVIHKMILHPTDKQFNGYEMVPVWDGQVVCGRKDAGCSDMKWENTSCINCLKKKPEGATGYGN